MRRPIDPLAACLTLCALALGAPTSAQDAAPSREDTADYFASVRADLYTCARGWHGEVRVAVTFSGDGRVTAAVVDEAVPTEVGSCVRGVLRGGRMRAFGEREHTVEHTLRL